MPRGEKICRNFLPQILSPFDCAVACNANWVWFCLITDHDKTKNINKLINHNFITFHLASMTSINPYFRFEAILWGEIWRCVVLTINLNLFWFWGSSWPWYSVYLHPLETMQFPSFIFPQKNRFWCNFDGLKKSNILFCFKYSVHDYRSVNLCGLYSTKELKLPTVIDLNLKQIARGAWLNNNPLLSISLLNR